MYQSVILFCIGLFGGLASGLLGIGGGIVLAPMLLYVPPMLAQAPLDMKTVSGLTMVQSCVASLSAARVHNRFRQVHPRLVVIIGVPVAIASFGGAAWSRQLDSRVLLLLFALMALMAAGLMFVPKPSADLDVALEEVRFNAAAAVVSALVLGLLGGIVGQSGSFLLIPVMIYLLHIPTRVALGSSLGIVLCAAVAGTIGKVLARQVELQLALPLMPAAFVGAYLGGHLSRQVPTRRLRYGVGFVSAAAAARILYSLSGLQGSSG